MVYQPPIKSPNGLSPPLLIITHHPVPPHSLTLIFSSAWTPESNCSHALILAPIHLINVEHKSYYALPYNPCGFILMISSLCAYSFASSFSTSIFFFVFFLLLSRGPSPCHGIKNIFMSIAYFNPSFLFLIAQWWGILTCLPTTRNSP